MQVKFNSKKKIEIRFSKFLVNSGPYGPLNADEIINFWVLVWMVF